MRQDDGDRQLGRTPSHRTRYAALVADTASAPRLPFQPAAARSQSAVLPCCRGSDGYDHAPGRDRGGSPRDAAGRSQVRAQPGPPPICLDESAIRATTLSPGASRSPSGTRRERDMAARVTARYRSTRSGTKSFRSKLISSPPPTGVELSRGGPLSTSRGTRCRGPAPRPASPDLGSQ